MDALSHRVRITVQLRTDAARELTVHQARSNPTLNLLELIESAGAELKPIFGGVADPALEAWFTVIVADSAAPALLISLQHHEAVLAAYIKPPESPP